MSNVSAQIGYSLGCKTISESIHVLHTGLTVLIIVSFLCSLLTRNSNRYQASPYRPNQPAAHGLLSFVRSGLTLSLVLVTASLRRLANCNESSGVWRKQPYQQSRKKSSVVDKPPPRSITGCLEMGWGGRVWGERKGFISLSSSLGPHSRSNKERERV